MASITSFLLLVSLVLASCSLTICFASEYEVEKESEFAYVEGGGKGPRSWGKIDPHWEACGKGHMQDYRAAPAAVKNRGHDIAVIWKGDAGKITINDTNYHLKQCHWHSPSEHTFNGSRHVMELHLVHYSSQGGIAVAAIVYEYGRPDHFLSKLFRHITRVDPGEEIGAGIISPGDIKFGSRKYYRYTGSLTSPPCTEGVIWTVIKKVRTVSREQVKAIRDAVHDGYEANARPTQSSDGRTVFEYTPGEI
ncbi:CARBONIC ANHYDRASE [Salix purpurea]|uniref:CARBONIC ANHYDRASE n=1 Tax=Salix purpurea TaxID=77065 RepID=A0A9Q0Q5E0_SALPP|nr:CARBONIC ANHYDRASE [Salix purpurea]